MLTRRSFLKLSMVSAGALGLAACGGTAPAASPAAGGAAAPKAAGTLAVGFNDDPGYLAVNAVGTQTYNVTQHIFDSLFRYDAGAKLVPGLAESWTTSPDGITWTFKLRKGVKFHNGEDFTSEAIKYSIQKLQDPKATRRVYVSSIKEVQTPDDLTAVLVTSKPTPALPIYLAEIVDIYPPKYMAQVGDEAFNRKPVGSGPFKFVEWQKDQQITLQGNADYWGGAPKFDELVLRFIPQESTRVAELLAGNVQAINYPPVQQLPQIDASGIATAPSSKGTLMYHVILRTERKPFDDKRVRQALNYAVDVPSIIKQLYAGRGTQTSSAVPAHAFGFDPDLKPYTFDLAKAKQLLADAGYAGGLSFKMDVASDDKQLAEAVAGFWKQAGVTAELVLMEPAALVQAQDGKKIDDASLFKWAGPTFDADTIYTPRIFSKVPASYFNNPDMDKLIMAGGSTMDEAKRKDIYKQANQLFHDEAGWVFLLVPFYNFGVSTRLNWTPRADGQMIMTSAAPK